VTTPSDTAHPEGETLTDQHARAIADLELLRDRWDMDCSMGEACDMDAEWVRKAEWRYKRVQAAIDLLRQDAPPAPAFTPPR
jgi:hypothetical protein